MSEPSTSYGIRPARSLEIFAWLFMRLSGVLLLILALGHLVIMHLINNVGNINYEFVAGRWSGELGMLWRGYDWLMLTLALFHGVNGMRTIFEDYLRPGRARTLTLSLLYTSGAALFVLGSWIIFTFRRVM